MRFLVLAVVCSLAIGMIFKHGGRRGFDRLALLTVNYAAAMVLAALLLARGAASAAPAPPSAAPPALVALGLGMGVLFIVGFFLLALATEEAGMSLAIGVMRVSVVIPFLASWAVWGEVPRPAQGAGLLLAGVAFFLIARRTRPGSTRAPANAPQVREPARPLSARFDLRVLAILALLFLAGGTVDVLMKTFDEAFGGAGHRPFFLLLVFAAAFAVGAVGVGTKRVRTGQWPPLPVVGWGILLGLVNYGSVEFLLLAIERLSGPFVFPANNISLVIGAALLGVFVWKERLSRFNWMGLGLAAVALFLLSL